MACVTLKRSHNFDVLQSTGHKRRRCCNSPTCHLQFSQPKSVFIPPTQMTPSQIRRQVKDQIKRLQRRNRMPRLNFGSALAAYAEEEMLNAQTIHPSKEVNNSCTAMTKSLRSMAIRSPLPDSQSDSDSDQHDSNCPYLPGDDPQVNHPTSSQSKTAAGRPSIDSVPLFTLPQVTSLCDNLIKEREDQLREEYNSILSCKLAEQYESFLKFNHDQLCIRFKNAPMNYVS